MAEAQVAYQRSQEAILATNKVLRNTYLLLSMTLFFSALGAAAAMAINAPPMGLISLFVMLGMLYGIHKLKDSVWGLVMVFVFTGFMGFALGPILNYYMATANGTQTVLTALGLTGFIFLSLSGYTLTTQKDFSFLRGFIFVGLMVAMGTLLVLLIGPLFGFYVPGLYLAYSAGLVILASALILFDTSRIIHGGETNYLLATVSLYMDIYILFTHLLHLLGVFGGDD
jgi:modulator of FtsH protease